MNLSTFIILVILAVIIGAVVRIMIRDKKAGKGCGGCAGGCGHADTGLGESQLSGNVDGADIGLFLGQHEYGFQIIFC